MAVVAPHAGERADRDSDSVRPFVWTRARLRQLLDAGVIREGDRVELVDGELIAMPVQKEPHALAVGLVGDTLQEIFGASHHVREQQPVALDECS